MITTDYDLQVSEYLLSIGATVTVKLADVQTCPAWGCEPTKYTLKRDYNTAYKGQSIMCRHSHGFEYKVSVCRGSVTVDLGSFWNSFADRYTESHFQALSSIGTKPPKELPSAYDVLSCFCPDAHALLSTFEEWCSELGYDTDSRKAEQTYRACVDIGIKLQRVFTAEQLQHLQEIAS